MLSIDYITPEEISQLYLKSKFGITNVTVLCKTFKNTKDYKQYNSEFVKIYTTYEDYDLDRYGRGLSNEFLIVEDNVSEERLKVLLTGIAPIMAQFTKSNNINLLNNIFYIKGKL